MKRLHHVSSGGGKRLLPLPRVLRFCFVSVAVFVATGTSVRAASFDCAKARRGYEALICANDELSKADDAMGDDYRRALDALASIDPEKEAKKAQKRLEKEQKEWLKTRQSKCPDVDCLRTEYKLRRATLKSYVPGGNTAARPSNETQSAVQVSLRPSTASDQVPEAATTPQEITPLPPPITEDAPQVQSEQVAEIPEPPNEKQPPSALDGAAEDHSPAAVPPSDRNGIESGNAENTRSETSSGRLSLFWCVFFFIYVMWGMYWGWQLVSPRMMAWYNSTTFLVSGNGPLDILKRQIFMGLEMRIGALVIGTIVGCLGGAFYMQFFRSASSRKVLKSG